MDKIEKKEKSASIDLKSKLNDWLITKNNFFYTYIYKFFKYYL